MAWCPSPASLSFYASAHLQYFGSPAGKSAASAVTAAVRSAVATASSPSQAASARGAVNAASSPVMQGEQPC